MEQYRNERTYMYRLNRQKKIFFNKYKNKNLHFFTVNIFKRIRSYRAKTDAQNVVYNKKSSNSFLRRLYTG